MKYFISRRFFSGFSYEIVNKDQIKKIESYDNLKIGDIVTVLEAGLDFHLTLKEIKDNELYFVY